MEMIGSGRGAEQGYDNRKRIPPDLEAKAQYYEKGVGSLPSQQQGTHPFVPPAQQLISSSDNNNNIPRTCGATGGLPMDCGVGGQPFKTSNFYPRHRYPPGMTLPRTAWVRLNSLRNSVGCFHSCLYIWGMASSAAS